MNSQANDFAMLALRAALVALVLMGAPGVLGAAEGPAQEPASSAAKAPDFETGVAPIFQAKCAQCHGEKERKADLDLRTPASILKGGESGEVVVPGDLEGSLLYEKVLAGEMPPDKKDRLSEAELATIRRWIEAGAISKAASDEPGPPNQHDVLPILLRRCTVCHGSGPREAGLDLRTVESIRRGGKSGPAIVPGKPEESLLIRRIHAGEMPPITRLIEVSIKPIEPAETELIAKWIAAGAPEADIAPDVPTSEPDPLVSDKDRDFWAFRAPSAVRPPSVKGAERARNVIDLFVLEKLEAQRLTLAPEADRATLLRRVSYDLTGLPPDPAEIEAFLADQGPGAYERLVERLLASPRYGERWGRAWLDLAGYADSEGKREQDILRPSAWRYRDYVIRAFNADKPYDRFLMEQIAGDELADCESAGEITAEMYDNLVATGFLRMAPDPTWYNLTNFLPDRLEVIADEIDVLGSAVLGLTIKCARCHSHKFDPIPHRDYYRLLDVFKGAFDEHDWMKPNWHDGLSMGPRSDRDLPFVGTADRRAWEEHTARLDGQIAAARAALDEKAAALAKKYTAERLAHLPEAIRGDVETMLGTPAEQRDAVQNYLAEKFEQMLRVGRDELLKLDADFRQQSEETDKQVAALAAQKLPEPKIRALWDRGEPSATYIYRRGDYLSPGRLVGPGPPSVLTDGRTPFEVTPPWPGAKKTGRRLALARWLVRPDHPLTARVMVNRLWKQHFGTGIVATLENFGRAGAPPSHPELLDWLAREFVRTGWSIKAMHRLMVTSATYRQSSAVTPEVEARDPGNALYSRMPMVRLSADQLYDAMLLVAGRLNETPFGPADAVEARPDGLVSVRGGAAGWRRSIYVQQQRKTVVTALESFDFPQMNPNCIERRDSTVVLQALHLMNNGMVFELAEAFARRVGTEAGPDPARQIERLYLLALSRAPSAQEVELGRAFLDRLSRREDAPADRAAATHEALVTYCHAILNSAEFVYVD